MDRVRIGILGAARIVPAAVLAPAKTVPRVEVVAIAAREQRRAQAFAARHGIPRVLADYAALIADPQIDAVYVPLPNGLHGRWTIKALEAGKHVLCEKPLAANAYEAEQMARAAARSGRLLMEAFHYRYHPLAERMKSIVDRAMTAEFQLPGGGSGRITCSLLSHRLLDIRARVVGEQGELRVLNPVAPQFFHRLTVITPDGKHVAQLSRRPTYEFQMQAFVRAVLEGAPIATGPEEGVANMRIIDAVYGAAGLRPRSPTVV